MRWFEWSRWSKTAARQAAKPLLGPFLGRNSDPKTLNYYASLIAKGAGPARIARELSQNQEYKSQFSARAPRGPEGGVCIWNDERYEAFLNAPKIREALIVKLDHIGDFLLALDAFDALRKGFPEARLTLLCAPWNAALARSLGFFDRVETLDFFAPTAEGESPAFARERLGDLADVSFDLAVDLRVEADTRALFDHIQATHKCGYASDACRSILTLSPPRPNVIFSDSLAANQRLLMLGLARSVVDFFHRDDSLYGEALRASLAGSTEAEFPFRGHAPLIAMHPFSGRSIKNWPFENFLRLGAGLTRELEASIVLLGTKKEAESVPDIAALCRSAGVQSLVGETSLTQAYSVIARSDLFIGNDSGLTHAAARMDIATLALYSGVAPIESWAPSGKSVTILHAPVACAPCYLPTLEGCEAEHACVRAIDVEFVQATARSLIERRSLSRDGGLAEAARI
jgi:ADP-heptose:LPS heptosyltransferase